MSSIQGELKLEYFQSARKNSRYRHDATLELRRDDKGRYWLSLGSGRASAFQVRGNVQKLYSQFVRDGKATIELIRPHVLLYIRESHPAELQQFLENIENLVVDPDFEIETSSAPEEAKEVPVPDDLPMPLFDDY